jgi:transcriptional regulator with XRE-family HTH domain
MHKIATNIKHLRSLRNWSQEQLATQLDIPRARIGSYEEGRCAPPVETLMVMSSLFHVAIDALIKCDLRKFDDTELMSVGENRLLFPIQVDKENNDVLEVVTLKASAGYLSGYADPEYIEKLPTMQLPFRTKGTHRAFPIQGDSMLPLQSGSYVIGQYVDSWKEIKNGHTYIVVTRNEGIVYKRLYRKEGYLELHSDNPLYSPYSLQLSEVVECWQFICALVMSDKKDEAPSLSRIAQQIQKLQHEVMQIRQAGATQAKS